jgi:hypothetical protein
VKFLHDSPPRCGDGARRARRESNHLAPIAPDLDTYDGWVTWYDTNTITVAPGSTLVTEWIVPLPPKTVGSQDIAFFNDFETKDIILQPVLDFSEIPGEWGIESENCCGPTGNGNDVQSAVVQVSAGDVIRGEIDMASCNAAGDCTNWTVKTTDVTTGKVTSLTIQNPGEAADEVTPAVLETYGVTSCDMLPANGEAQFFDNALTNGTAAEPCAVGGRGWNEYGDPAPTAEVGSPPWASSSASRSSSSSSG